MNQAYNKKTKKTTFKQNKTVEVEKHTQGEITEACFSVPEIESFEGSSFNNSHYDREISIAYKEYLEHMQKLNREAI